LHNISKCNLNSDLLSYIKYQHRGYLHNQILLTNRLIWSDDLSKISSLINFSLPLTVLVINHVIVGNSTTSNQLEAGSIMVRAMKSIEDPSLPLSVYGSTRSTHEAFQGVLITSLNGRCPYFCERFVFTWQDLHDFFTDRTVFCILFQYIADFIVSLRRVCPGCCRQWCRCNGFGITSLPLLHVQLLFSISWSSIPLSRTALRLKKWLNVVSACWASTISFTVKGYIYPPHCGLRIHDSFELYLFRLSSFGDLTCVAWLYSLVKLSLGS
jgi:hypothetical protein